MVRRRISNILREQFRIRLGLLRPAAPVVCFGRIWSVATMRVISALHPAGRQTEHGAVFEILKLVNLERYAWGFISGVY